MGSPAATIARHLHDITMALIQQATSGNVSAIALCLRVAQERDLAAEILVELADQRLRAAPDEEVAAEPHPQHP